MNKAETFITISKYPQYEVGDMGHVRVKATGEAVEATKHPRGVMEVSLTGADGVKQKELLNMLVCTAHVSNPNGLTCMDVKNGDLCDCRAANMEWITESELLLRELRRANTKAYNDYIKRQESATIAGLETAPKVNTIHGIDTAPTSNIKGIK